MTITHVTLYPPKDLASALWSLHGIVGDGHEGRNTDFVDAGDDPMESGVTRGAGGFAVIADALGNSITCHGKCLGTVNAIDDDDLYGNGRRVLSDTSLGTRSRLLSNNARCQRDFGS